MKLTLILLLCAASVALLRAEEVVEEVDEVEDETSVDFLHDGSLEDEVMGHDEDPGKHHKRLLLKKLGARRVCARVFRKCAVRMILKHRAGCRKTARVCKAKYYGCRCIVKGVRGCRRFLAWVGRMKRRHMRRHRRKHRRQDEEEDEDEDETEDAKRRRRRGGKGLRRRFCRALRRCKKVPGTKRFVKCVKISMHRQSRKGDEAEEDDDDVMADVAEEPEEELPTDDEDEDARRPRRKLSKYQRAMKGCGKRGVRCMLRARLHCRRQARCVRGVLRCVRLVKRRFRHHHRRHHGKH